MRLISFIICLCLCVAKANAQHKSILKKQPVNFWKTSFGITRDPKTDTINHKPVTYYLNHPKVASIAKNFYRGRFRPSDNDSTTRLLALVTTNNSDIRPFYRWCLDATIDIADGALGEYIGVPAYAYASKYPGEFFNYMDADKNKKRYSEWVEAIAYSGLPSYQIRAQELRKKIRQQMQKGCKPCSPILIKRIDRIAKDIVQAADGSGTI